MKTYIAVPGGVQCIAVPFYEPVLSTTGHSRRKEQTIMENPVVPVCLSCGAEVELGKPFHKPGCPRESLLITVQRIRKILCCPICKHTHGWLECECGCVHDVTVAPETAPRPMSQKRWEAIANEVMDGGTYKRHMIPESRRELKERIVDALVNASRAAHPLAVPEGQGLRVPPDCKCGHGYYSHLNETTNACMVGDCPCNYYERAESAPRAEGVPRSVMGTDGREHFRVTAGCYCGWSIINDFEWEQHLKQITPAQPRTMAEAIFGEQRQLTEAEQIALRKVHSAIERETRAEGVPECPTCGGDRIVKTKEAGAGYADDLPEYAPCPDCKPAQPAPSQEMEAQVTAKMVDEAFAVGASNLYEGMPRCYDSKIVAQYINKRLAAHTREAVRAALERLSASIEELTNLPIPEGTCTNDDQREGFTDGVCCTLNEVFKAIRATQPEQEASGR